MRFVCLCVTILIGGNATCLNGLSPQSETQRRRGTPRITEAGLRGLAIHAPDPHYPDRSLKNGSAGIVVVSVVVDEEGTLADSAVLESPDKDIEEAVLKAIRSWRFKPASIGRVSGKLTFYFAIEDGRGIVRQPQLSVQKLEGNAVRSGEIRRADQSKSVVVIDEQQIADLRRQTTKVVLVDIRSRIAYRYKHRPGTVNIPIDELLVRGPAELNSRSAIVIDCSFGDMNDCRVAALLLVEKKFQTVRVFRP